MLPFDFGKTGYARKNLKDYLNVLALAEDLPSAFEITRIMLIGTTPCSLHSVARGCWNYVVRQAMHEMIAGAEGP